MAAEKETVKKSTEKVALKKETSKEKQSGQKLAVILVRGLTGVPRKVKDTLVMLKLSGKNRCVVVENNPVKRGMLRKVKDYITWGEINEETFGELVEKRGEEWKGRLKDRKEKYSYRTFEVSGKKYKPYFRLNPPQKGFGRKGIKVFFKAGGALGYRGGKINELIERML